MYWWGLSNDIGENFFGNNRSCSRHVGRPDPTALREGFPKINIKLMQAYSLHFYFQIKGQSKRATRSGWLPAL